MDSEYLIFGFEEAFETAILQVLESVDLNTINMGSEVTFEKDRARCEVLFTPGASKGKLYVADGFGSVPGTTYETMFEFAATIKVVTQIEIEIHRRYLARIRNVCSTMNTRANQILQRHELLRFSCDGTDDSQTGENTAEGYRVTTLNYNGDFAIIEAALAELS